MFLQRELGEPEDDLFHGHHWGLPGDVSAWNTQELQAVDQ